MGYLVYPVLGFTPFEFLYYFNLLFIQLSMLIGEKSPSDPGILSGRVFLIAREEGVGLLTIGPCHCHWAEPEFIGSGLLALFLYTVQRVENISCVGCLISCLSIQNKSC